jgi:hypothetical protein
MMVGRLIFRLDIALLSRFDFVGEHPVLGSGLCCGLRVGLGCASGLEADVGSAKVGLAEVAQFSPTPRPVSELGV